MTTQAPPRVLSVLEALTRPLLTDRTLPPIAGTPPEAFEALYARRPDPWGVLTSPVAQQRQLALIEVVSQYAPCHSILDVGCGEGALTRYLIGSARVVAGIDASQTAIDRARGLVPKATFCCCTLEDFPVEQRFDIVLAVEILYYVKAIDLAIDKLLELGRVVIISYTNRERERLEPHIDAYGTAAVRSYHSFFGLKHFGFTIIRLMPSARSTM